nr:MAG: ORF1 [Torque teno virus]USL90490.1 MAG: ORF1 [Torque teno virus]
MAWWRYRRRGWRPWRRRRWPLRRRRSRRTFRRRGRRRYVSRRPRRRYRRRLRRGRRRRGRRRRHRQTLVLRQWQPDVIKKCFITGWLPFVICGSGNTQFNFVTHEEDIPPAKASYGGNFTNLTFTLAGLFEQHLLHRNRWSKSNFDLELARYIGTTLKLYRHETVDYIITYNRTGPFEINELSYMFTHPLLMLLNKHHIVVPSLRTKPKGKRYKKVHIKPPKLMINKWYFAKDICKIGLFQIYGTGLELSNPWLRSGTKSPIVGFHVLKPSLYEGAMSNLQTEEFKQNRKTLFEKLLPTNLNKPNEDNWQYTYTQLMSKIYFQTTKTGGQKLPTPYNWKNYKENYSDVKSKWDTLNQAAYNLVKEEYNQVYKVTSTFPYEWTNRNYLSHDCGIFSPYFLTPNRYTPEWHCPWTYIRYNPLSDKGIGNRIYVQWVSEASCKYDKNKSKCMLQDMPLYMMLYGYMDYAIKCTGSKSLWTDARIAIRCPYTDPPLTGSTTDVGFIPIAETFMNGDMPWPSNHIPLKLWFKWFPMLFNQKQALENIVSCGPFMPRDQEAKSWDITVGYKAIFKWGGSPLPPQPIDDPCQKGTHEIPDPDKHPPRIQISDPQHLGPETIFHSFDIRRGLFSSTSLKRVSEYQPPDDPFSTGVVFKRPRLETQYSGTRETPEEDAYSLLKALQKEQESSTSEEETAQEEEIQKHQLLQQLRVQQQQQRVLRKGLQQVLGDVLRLRKGVHWDPTL